MEPKISGKTASIGNSARILDAIYATGLYPCLRTVYIPVDLHVHLAMVNRINANSMAGRRERIRAGLNKNIIIHLVSRYTQVRFQDTP